MFSGWYKLNLQNNMANSNLSCIFPFVIGLEPYTKHGYVMSACTDAACANSSQTNITTLQDLPEGMVLIFEVSQV